MLELLIDPEPFELEAEILGGPAFAGLTLAERKAVAITSTLETGEAGGFFGLSSNFDGKGLSFGLVNWNIGSGSLQPLLRDFYRAFPARWAAAFGPDAARFKAVLDPKDDAAKVRQLKFVIDEANTRVMSKRHKKLVWVIKEPWAAYFRRLANDPELQKIQVRYVHGILLRAKQFCDQLGLRSERAFCFMFDACSSHGQWWNAVKDRQSILDTKLAFQRIRHGGSLPERAILTAVAETLSETSRPKYRQRVLDRKLWFLTGKLPDQEGRETKLRAIPLTDEPFTISTVAPVGGYDPMIDISIMTSFAKGARTHSDLASEAFYLRHPERKRAPIRASESAAKREWTKLRTRATQLFPKLGEHELDDELEAGSVMNVLKSLITGGQRDPSKLASDAFYALHPERSGKPIDAKREPGAVKEWKALRAQAVQALPVEPPRLLEKEESALGTTYYFAINLGIPKIKPMTAVFVPHGYRHGPTVDLMLYLHGHTGPTPIKSYFRREDAPVRQRVAASKKNIILVAPSLGMRSESGVLVEKGGLDRFLGLVLAGLGVARGANPTLRHLILAAHSGGGTHMATLAVRESRAAVQNVRACWGFDCFYNPLLDPPKWLTWARRYPDRTLTGWYHASQPETVTAIVSENLPNIRLRRSRHPNHWTSIGDETTGLIDRAAFLEPR
ncbi:MAG: hypothetical protein M4D80_13435 [Myxococcota bacterium]|nr:hypothetical protein [Deltaproteobacteria bacterium]MDQ3336166.1 hypothetical protein [Myxococcota bacterium]